jgi:superfamily I DNA and RNA helicase
MSLEVIYGESRNRPIALQLAEALSNAASEGTIYLGYPVLASADDRVSVDALLVSREHGLVAFLLADDVAHSKAVWEEHVAAQDRLFAVLESYLGRHDELRRRRQLAFEVQTITVFPSPPGAPPFAADGYYCDLASVAAIVNGFASIDEGVLRSLQAALQRVSTIKPAKRRDKVTQPTSRGAIIKEIEKEIANLDRWQKQAAIETPEGPQRIRGLAGSGKTVVLALKAAYLHAIHPEWQIAVTFQSRALYQQLEDLITRFSFEHSNDKPDFDRLGIVHAWGSGSKLGVYTMIADAMRVVTRDFNYASATYGRDGAFAGVCRELLDIAKQSDDPPIFDAVLIDEAQDLPAEFFQLIYRFTREPKLIVWAFDELQNLSEASMPPTEDLFGVGPGGDALVTLVEAPREARKDIILPVCYRNTPWALATAHAVGFGVYRDDGLVQHFDEPQLWNEIGYATVSGRLEPGEHVTLQRAQSSYPDYFPRLLDPSDAVVLKKFENEVEQDSWVAEQILTNLEHDELEYDDILVVLPDAYTSKRRSTRFARILSRHGIECHLAGVSSSVDQVFMKGSVALAHIYRAKGNEAPMVYVLDSQWAARTQNIVSRRNTLFTAITRSRAWVRIAGWGDAMDQVAAEVEAVRNAGFKLDFTIPTVEELARLRRIHRDRSDREVASLKRATRGAKELVEAFERGEVDIDDLPDDIRGRLISAIREELDGGE